MGTLHTGLYTQAPGPLLFLMAPTLTPFIVLRTIICLLSELKPSPPSFQNGALAPALAQIWEDKHTGLCV